MKPAGWPSSPIPFFAGLDPRYLELAVGCASNMRFNAGEFIFRAGEEANHFYLIREGKVSLEVFVPARGSLTVQTLRGGDILGWSWLVPPYTSKFDARAAERTRAIVLDGSACVTNAKRTTSSGTSCSSAWRRFSVRGSMRRGFNSWTSTAVPPETGQPAADHCGHRSQFQAEPANANTVATCSAVPGWDHGRRRGCHRMGE